MNRKVGFWNWLGHKIASGLKGYLAFGGWATIPMVIQGYLTDTMTNLPDSYQLLMFLWIIPMSITAAYQIYKDDDC